ncbi:MAG: TonB-dependent receptor [Candidatus Accumulibacter sp.]|nr:TonB-dependent receptor [Accumulibacter sp.]
MKRTLISASIASLLLSCPALAQNPNLEESATLDTMVVTASRSAEKLRDVSQSMVVITQKEIRESASDNVLDLLTRYGFQIAGSKSPNYDERTLKMRGLTSSYHGIDLNGEILVLIDGRRTGTDNFGILDMNTIARIEVVRGPGAMQYGSSAIGGVVNVITERGAKETDVELEAGIGSWGAKTAKAFASGQSNDGRFDYAVSASRYSVDDYEDGKGVRNLNSALDSREKYAVNLGWNIDKDNRIGLAAQHTDTNRAGIGTYDDTDSTRKQYKDNDYRAFDFSYEGKTQNKSWLLRYFTGRTRYELTRRASSSDHRMDIFSDYDNKFQGAQGTLNLDADRFELVTGIDYLHYDLNQNQPVSLVRPDGKRSNYTNGKYTNIGAFAIGKAHLLEERNLVLSAGLRYDSFKSDMDTSYTTGASSPGRRKISNTQRKFLPSLGAVYHPLDHLKLRANYGHAFKMPAPREQAGAFYMATMSTSPIFVGNPDIKPEQSKTWDIGVDFDYRALKLYATYFDTHYKDKISASPAVSGERLYVNLNKVYLRGVEAGASFDLGRHLNWGSNFEPYLALTQMTKYEDNTGEKLADIAKMNASFGLRFHRPAEKLSANLDFVYYGQTLGYKGEGAKREKFKVGGRTIANLSLVKSIAGFSPTGNLKMKVVVDNLFDKYYRLAAHPDESIHLPGRSFYVGLICDLK